MNNSKLIENIFPNQLSDLPAVYKILQSSIIKEEVIKEENPTIFTKSSRHQTVMFPAMRFYKNITFFEI